MSQVDVVIPCFKYAHYLEACVATVLSQRDVGVRVLIVDDASPDNTPEVAARIAASDPRVACIRNEKNLGLMATVNRGVIDWASSEYVVAISADDRMAPGALARATRLMDANPEVAMTYGKACMFADEPPGIADVGEAPSQVVSGRAFLRQVCQGANPVPSPCAVMRTRVQHRIGGYSPRFKHTCDLDTWMRAAAVGSIGIVNAVQGFYRWHAANMSSAFHLRPVGDRREIIENCRDFESRHGAEFPEFSGWVADMERRFGYDALVAASKFYEQPDTEAWREALAFAKQYLPDYEKTAAWRKFRIKQAMGRKAAAALRRAATRLSTPNIEPPWYAAGNQIGWWPEPRELAE